MKRYSRVYASVNLDAAIENMEAMHRLLKKDTSMFAVIKQMDTDMVQRNLPVY